jgi:general secretion pathway protein D
MSDFPNLPLRALTLACLAVIAGCSTPPPRVPAALDFPRSGDSRSTGNFGDQPLAGPGETVISSSPRPPQPIGGNLRPIAPKAVVNEEAGDLSVAFEQIALPGFIQAVYGGILKLNYSLDPAVAARTELITFRTPKPLGAAKLTEVSAQLLKSYGIAVQDFGGVLRIVNDTNTSSTLPLVRRGRAQPGVPLPLRPIFHYIETESVRPSTFLPTLNTILGTKVVMTVDGSGGLLVSGQPEDVSVALELIQVFDQPGLRSQNTTRIIPRYWGAQEFATRLSEVLRLEGYGVGNQPTSGEPITVFGIPAVNSVLVFATSKEVLSHVLDWVAELDQLPTVQSGNAYFTYPVRNADAQELAKSLNELISGVSAPTATSSTGTGSPIGGSTSVSTAVSTAPRGGKRVVVNNATNSLIFQGGNQDDYRQWLSLLAQLDKPVKSALIDVLVAEVTLNDNSDLGFTWKLEQLGSNASSIKLGNTTYSTTLGGSGLGINAFLGGSGLRTLAIKALASNTDARIVSNPKVLTRNGESANISVGQDVPVVVSQGVTTSSGTLGSTTTNVVPQNIQYRNTGVILRVRPVIHAGDRIDIEINQEVSGAVPTATGVDSSPTINRSSIDTKLSLRDGATVMLGGLISEDSTDTNAGVPGLKDIPGFGALFRNTIKERKRKELVILITPYILNDSSDAEAATDAFNSSLGAWADGVRGRVDAVRTARKLRADQISIDAGTSGAAAAPRADTNLPRPSRTNPAGTPAANPIGNPVGTAPARPVSAPAAPPAPAGQRMINLNNSSGTGLPSNEPGPAAGQAGSSAAPQVNAPAPPGRKAAPAVIDGFSTPPGSTIVDDPKLKEEILRDLKR